MINATFKVFNLTFLNLFIDDVYGQKLLSVILNKL